MPPRAAKKAATKRPSPRVKGASPPAVRPSPSSAEEKADPMAADSLSQVEGAKTPEASASPHITAVKVESPKPAVKEEQIVEVQASEDLLPVTESGAEAVEVRVSEDPLPEPESGTEAALPVKIPEAVPVEDRMDVEEGVAKAGKITSEAEVVDATGVGTASGNIEGDSELNGDSMETHDNADDEGNEEYDPSIYMQASLTERNKQKEFEIFIGGLHKEAVEEDLEKVFGVFGDIQSLRIVRHPASKKSKGFAFVRFATIEHAKKALEEFNDGIEVKGKRAGVSAKMDNDTLYLGNICKTWTQDIVIETLKGLGVEHIEDMILPEDPKNEGKLKGFAFIEFDSHADAIAAFQRLRKPDAVFGCDRSAKVAFSSSMHPSEEAMRQVKTVYVEGIPDVWDEERIKELCKKYGEIEKVQLSRNINKAKRKDFAYVEFTSRESAVVCVEGINSAQLGEGETKVKANLAKPPNTGRLGKQGTRGGFNVTKDGEHAGQSKKKSSAKTKQVSYKGKTQSKPKNTVESQPSKSLVEVTEGKSDLKETHPVKGKKHVWRGVDATRNERPSKKARKNQNHGKMHGKLSQGFGNQRNTYSGMTRNMEYVAYPAAYTPSANNYRAHAYTGTIGLTYEHADLEPHAGYLSSARQVQNPYRNEWRRSGVYNSQQGSSSTYAGAVPVDQPSYPVHPSYAGYEAGYAYPYSGPYGRTYY